MKLKSLNCPNCGSNVDVSINEGQKFTFCSQCGSKLVIDDEVQRTEVTHKGEVVHKLEGAEKIEELAAHIKTAGGGSQLSKAEQLAEAGFLSLYINDWDKARAQFDSAIENYAQCRIAVLGKVITNGSYDLAETLRDNVITSRERELLIKNAKDKGSRMHILMTLFSCGLRQHADAVLSATSKPQLVELIRDANFRGKLLQSKENTALINKYVVDISRWYKDGNVTLPELYLLYKGGKILEEAGKKPTDVWHEEFRKLVGRGANVNERVQFVPEVVGNISTQSVREKASVAENLFLDGDAEAIACVNEIGTVKPSYTSFINSFVLERNRKALNTLLPYIDKQKALTECLYPIIVKDGGQYRSEGEGFAWAVKAMNKEFVKFLAEACMESEIDEILPSFVSGAGSGIAEWEARLKYEAVLNVLASRVPKNGEGFQKALRIAKVNTKKYRANATFWEGVAEVMTGSIREVPISYKVPAKAIKAVALSVLWAVTFFVALWLWTLVNNSPIMRKTYDAPADDIIIDPRLTWICLIVLGAAMLNAVISCIVNVVKCASENKKAKREAQEKIDAKANQRQQALED